MNYDEWLGDDHSPSHPKLSFKDLAAIHRGGYSYNPLALNEKDEAFEYAVRSELDFIASKFGKLGISDTIVQKIIKNAKKVRGGVPFKVAVALYAMGLYDPDTLTEYMKLKGKEVKPGDLFHYAYKYGLKKIRKKLTFEEVISQNVEARVLPRSQLERAKKLFDELFDELSKDPELMGRKPSTIGRIALKKVLEEMGYGA